MHIGQALINGNASGGKNCSLLFNTGLVTGGLNADSPILEDGVVVGLGAVVGKGRFAKNIDRKSVV